MKRLMVGVIGLLIVLGVVFLVFYLWGGSIYDKTLPLQETVDQEWADVQASYQRRADLLPNLAAAVKNAAKTEKEILIEVTKYRSGMAGLREDINNSETPQQLIAVGGRMRRGIGWMMENYPEIKSMESFQQLQAQIEGTENRINIAREDYNQSVKLYNSHIRGYFKSMALDMFAKEGDNFTTREYFEATDNADHVPDVDILLN